MACMHYQMGRYRQAQTFCEQILSAVPGHRDALLLLALLAQRGGKAAAGDEFFRQAMESETCSVTFNSRLDASPRWLSASPNPHISAVLAPGLENYRQTLQGFEQFTPWLDKISFEANPLEPGSLHWNNVWLPVLDAVALYCLVALKRPRNYIEIGSGNSTKFVARAVKDHGLNTRIISIDPQPRAEIDALCHDVKRVPLEKCDLSIFSTLGENDIVFADNSHRTYMNSDVTVFFCEILPQLARGVTVGIHDIFLPCDYPEDWTGRYYSEQYLLSCYLLARTQRFDVTLPLAYAVSQGLGQDLVRAVRSRNNDELWRGGTSFWMCMR